MQAVKQFVFWVLSVGSWALALYLFYEGNVGGGLGALCSSYFFAVAVGFGRAFADKFGPTAIKDAEKRGYEKGAKVSELRRGLRR